MIRQSVPRFGEKIMRRFQVSSKLSNNLIDMFVWISGSQAPNMLQSAQTSSKQTSSKKDGRRTFRGGHHERA